MNKLLAPFLLISLYTTIPSVSYAAYTMHIVTEQKDGGSLADNSIVFVDKSTSVEPVPTSPVPTPEPKPEAEPDEPVDDSFVTIFESGFNQYSPYKYIGNGNAYILDEFSEYKETMGKDYGQVIIYLKQSVDRYLDNGDYYVSNGSPQQCDFAAERCPDQCGKFPEAINQGFSTVLTPVGDRAACYSALHPNGSKGYDNLVIRFRK